MKTIPIVAPARGAAASAGPAASLDPSIPHADIGFLFVAPKVARAKQQHPFPYGMAYVSAMLRRCGFRVSCLDLSFSDEPVELQVRQRIERDSIDVVCTGGMSVDFHAILEVLEISRKIDRNLKTVVGGAMVTCDPELAIDALQMDFGVMGEGEYIMSELALALSTHGDPGTITGLVFRDAAGTVINTGTRKSTKELDELPFPDYEAFEFGRHLPMMKPNNTNMHMLDSVRMANINTSRSCPFGCTFCYQQLGRVYRQRSMDNVFHEIDYLIEHYGINALDISDDLFSVNKERLLEFAARIKPYGIKWSSQFRVKDANFEVLSVLREAGLVRISYGVESVDDSILISMKKKIKVKDIEHGLAETRRANRSRFRETFCSAIRRRPRRPSKRASIGGSVTRSTTLPYTPC
jgi:anaerobic magnesium-protoporphyrin IX monomethyl ester cyclase